MGKEKTGRSRAEHARQAADRLRHAQDFALFLGSGATRDQTIDRGLHEPHAERQCADAQAEHRQAASERQDQETGGDQREAAEQQVLLAKAPGQ